MEPGSRRSRRSWAALVWALVLAVPLLGLGEGGLPGDTIPAAEAAPLAAPDNSIILQPALSGFSQPGFMTNAGDGSGRLFVVELGGVIKVVVNGVTRPTPFLDLRSVVQVGGEQGLLGLAFHPDYEHNGRFFVFYTAKPPPNQTANVGSNTLEEYHATPGADVADPTPVRTLFALPDRAVNHNAGMLGFSPVDSHNYLYVTTGDEGGGGDTFGNSQNLDSLFAKMLRLDVDNIPSGRTYGIPPTNPYVGQSDVKQETWAWGLRNPWRWSFDRQTGDIYIGDVGQGMYEEIDVLPSLLAGQSGRNFGWNVREGAHCYNAATCSSAGFTDPVLEYDHSQGCAVIGGYRYRGTVSQALQGAYFYADECSGRVWRATSDGGSWSSVVALDTTEHFSSFGEDEAGEIYLVALSGTIYHVIQAPSCASRPRVVMQASRLGTGTYLVTLSASDNAGVTGNVLNSVQFTRITNGSVTIGSQTNQRNPFTATLPGTGPLAQFTVQRVQAGQAMHVDLSVTDRCGAWKTFFGAGTGAN
jgi:glucose/arabinose dehydrogenase